MEKKRVNLDMKQYGMFLALIVIYLIFAVLTGGKNLTPMNINNLVMQNGYVVILAIGMLLCVLTGNVDLGVGSVVALCGASAGIVMMDYKMNMWVAIFAALLIIAAYAHYSQRDDMFYLDFHLPTRSKKPKLKKNT